MSGIAPVTKRSGKSHLVVMRYACNQRLRNALYHWARAASQTDPLSRATYRAMRQRGHSHPRALRSLADRLLAVACAMLRNATLYDPAQRKNSGEDQATPPPPHSQAVIGSPACTAATA